MKKEYILKGQCQIAAYNYHRNTQNEMKTSLFFLKQTIRMSMIMQLVTQLQFSNPRLTEEMSINTENSVYEQNSVKQMCLDQQELAV